MNYCILNDDNIIENVIVCDDDVTAAEFGAVQSYDGAVIGQSYDPPDPEPAPEPEPTELEQLRADVDYIAMETGVEL